LNCQELAAQGSQLWNSSKFASLAVGTPIERLMEYVEAQKKGFVQGQGHHTMTHKGCHFK
jgi:hypothetical protein